LAIRFITSFPQRGIILNSLGELKECGESEKNTFEDGELMRNSSSSRTWDYANQYPRFPSVT